MRQPWVVVLRHDLGVAGNVVLVHPLVWCPDNSRTSLKSPPLRSILSDSELPRQCTGHPTFTHSTTPGGKEIGVMTEYVATRWYHAPEIMLSFKMYTKVPALFPHSPHR